MGSIGFFDSGLGGLSIMRAVEQYLPQYVYSYYGDMEHLPYGDKNEQEIFELTRRGVRKLFADGAVVVIVACNTASSETLRRLQNTFVFNEYPDRRVLGVIIPTIEEIIERRVQNALLIGTQRTISSGKYQKELRKKTIKGTRITGVATPELVPLIENDRIHEALNIVRPIIDTHRRSGGDGIILGCTHYCMLKDDLRSEFADADMVILSQDELIPSKLKAYLNIHPEIKGRLDTHDGESIKENIFTTS